MSLVGLDCGPTRLPQLGLQPNEIEQMRRELEAAGFHEASGVKP